MSGLSPDEAREFHRQYMLGFILFTAVAVVAHILVWQWRPWLPGPEGYASLIDAAEGAKIALSHFTSQFV